MKKDYREVGKFWTAEKIVILLTLAVLLAILTALLKGV